VVVPQHVAFFHVLVGDVGDINVQPTVPVIIPDVHVHALASVVADGCLGDFRKGTGPVTLVEKQSISAIIDGQVDVITAYVVEIAMPQIQRPARMAGKAGRFGYLDKAAFTVCQGHVVPQRHTAPVIGVI